MRASCLIVGLVAAFAGTSPARCAVPDWLEGAWAVAEVYPEQDMANDPKMAGYIKGLIKYNAGRMVFTVSNDRVEVANTYGGQTYIGIRASDTSGGELNSADALAYQGPDQKAVRPVEHIGKIITVTGERCEPGKNQGQFFTMSTQSCAPIRIIRDASIGDGPVIYNETEMLVLRRIKFQTPATLRR